MALILCLFVGTSMLLVAGICTADETNYYYYSNQGNNLRNIMYTEVDLGNSTEAYLDFYTTYDNEPGDFAIAFITKKY
jgi:bacillopeptidase F (M6 metalloprotease family)